MNSSTRRLVRDVKEALQYSIDSSGIYYKHDEEKMLVGYALIIGHDNTPYQFGNYLFKFEFPEDYPFSPPKVTFMSNDKVIRYHPNFYKNGRCCLSILNTWKGEQWTSCQTILSVLLSISSMFQNNPLLMEPGVQMNHPDLHKYNTIITFKNIDFTFFQIYKMTLKKLTLHDPFEHIVDLFKPEISNNFNANKYFLFSFIKQHINDTNAYIYTQLYNIKHVVSYNELYSSNKYLE